MFINPLHDPPPRRSLEPEDQAPVDTADGLTG
jgi:hypothetical protein